MAHFFRDDLLFDLYGVSFAHSLSSFMFISHVSSHLTFTGVQHERAPRSNKQPRDSPPTPDKRFPYLDMSSTPRQSIFFCFKYVNN